MKYAIEQDTATDRFTATVSDLGVDRLTALLQHLNIYWGIPFPSPGSTTGSYTVALASMTTLINYLFNQNKIMGIKLVRTITGWSLEDARRYCERITEI